MSEITKGKMERKGDLLRIDSNVIFTVARQGRTETEVAYAEENLRRWNAFEDGGLVEELRTACEEAQKVFGFIAENYKSAPHFPNAERLVEAALAKS